MTGLEAYWRMTTTTKLNSKWEGKLPAVITEPGRLINDRDLLGEEGTRLIAFIRLNRSGKLSSSLRRVDTP